MYSRLILLYCFIFNFALFIRNFHLFLNILKQTFGLINGQLIILNLLLITDGVLNPLLEHLYLGLLLPQNEGQRLILSPQNRAALPQLRNLNILIRQLLQHEPIPILIQTVFLMFNLCLQAFLDLSHDLFADSRFRLVLALCGGYDDLHSFALLPRT